MLYIEKTETYNDRRYAKPWMAMVTTSTTKNFSFLDWEGRPGCAGEFSFEVEPGTILAYGQKDLRKGRGGIDGYQLTMPDGTITRSLGGLSPAEVRRMAPADRVIAVAQAIVDKARAATPPDQKIIERFSAFLPAPPVATEEESEPLTGLAECG